MDIQWISLKKNVDERGQMIVVDPREFSFNIKRVYCLTDLNEHPRGFHAHKDLQQIMVCLSGTCSITLDNGWHKKTLTVSKKSDALVIDRMVWHELFEFSSDCILMFVTSDYYDEADYIRDYGTFMRAVNDDK